MKRESRVPCEHKQHIIYHTAMKFQFHHDQSESMERARAIVNFVLDKIIEATQTTRLLELRGFGSFRIVRRKPRVARNPRSNKLIRLPAADVVRFRPGKAFTATRKGQPDEEPEK